MIDSVEAQTLLPRRCILADDGSSDDSVSIALAAGWEVVQTEGTREQGAGIGAGRNAALAVIDTEFVAFMDADDWWEPDHLEDCIQLLEANPTAVVCFGSLRRTTHETDDPLPIAVPARVAFDAQEKILRSNFVVGAAAVVRRRAVVSAGLLDASLRAAEDYDLWLRMASLGQFIFRGKRSLFYRMHEGQTSKRTLLMGDTALRVRAAALSRIRAQDHAPDPMRALVDASRKGWEESLDILWYYCHLDAYVGWARRFRDEFGQWPVKGKFRVGLGGRVVTIVRRLMGRGV